MRTASSRKSAAKFTALFGVSLILAGSGCVTRNPGEDSPVDGKNAAASDRQVAADYSSIPASGSSSAGTESTQSASGLVYDQPYIWAQPASTATTSDDGSPAGQRFSKYVFHRNGTCDCYSRTRASWLGPNDDSESPAWMLQIGGAPFQIKSAASGSSIRVDWSKCQPDTPCAKTGANSDDGFLDIESAGFRLLDTSDQTVYILQKS